MNTVVLQWKQRIIMKLYFRVVIDIWQALLFNFLLTVQYVGKIINNY